MSGQEEEMLGTGLLFGKLCLSHLLQKFLHANWLIFIVNKRTERRIYNLWDASTSKVAQIDVRSLLGSFPNMHNIRSVKFGAMTDHSYPLGKSKVKGGGGGRGGLHPPQLRK